MSEFAGSAWTLPICLAVASVAARVVYDVAYRDHDRVLRALLLRDGPRAQYYRPSDVALAPLPFLWCWTDIFASAAAAVAIGHPLASAAAAVWIAGRMRGLQEVGHIGVHYGLCRPRAWQAVLTSAFFQYPIWKRSFRSRRNTHCVEHHPRPNVLGKDPNLARLVAAGMKPYLTRGQFYRRLLFPLGPRGIWTTLRAMWDGVVEERSALEIGGRAAAVAATVGSFVAISGVEGLLWFYALPLLLLYPLFTWISLLTEHRWFAPVEDTDRISRECTACRPTEFPGISGALAKTLVLPYSDHFHLAHSLFPFVRWNHLPAIDRELRARDDRYARFASRGLLIRGPEAPSALSELMDRLTARPPETAV